MKGLQRITRTESNLQALFAVTMTLIIGVAVLGLLGQLFFNVGAINGMQF